MWTSLWNVSETVFYQTLLLFYYPCVKLRYKAVLIRTHALDFLFHKYIVRRGRIKPALIICYHLYPLLTIIVYHNLVYFHQCDFLNFHFSILQYQRLVIVISHRMFEMHVYQYINRYLYDKLKIKDGPKHIKDGFKHVFISKSALQKYIK